jgi:hypothetical protein
MKKMNLTGKTTIIGFLVIAVLFFTACAHVTPITDCVNGEPYGFLGGLWHGIIAPFSFVCSLFMDDVAMYAVNNNGGWYDFGFVLGAGILFGGGGKASK